jgi:HK97 gp10 family phage protein
MALAGVSGAQRYNRLYKGKGYRRQSDQHPQPSLGDIALRPGRAEGEGVAFNLFPQFAAWLPRALAGVVVETTEAVARRATEKVPERTGTLKASQHIRFSKSKQTGQIVSGRIDYKAVDPTAKEPNHEYAFFVEVGTHNTKAQPFLIPALIAERPEFNRRVRELIK